MSQVVVEKDILSKLHIASLNIKLSSETCCYGTTFVAPQFK